MHIGTELLIHFLAVISCWFQPVGLACGHNREAHNNGGSEWSRAPRGPPPGNHCPPVPRISDSHCRVSGWSMRPAWGQRAHCNFLQGCQLRLGLNISSEEAGNWGEGKKTYNFEQSPSFSTISLLSTIFFLFKMTLSSCRDCERCLAPSTHLILITTSASWFSVSPFLRWGNWVWRG